MTEERVRVIAGELKGRSIAAPPGTTARPTYDRVRESLFGMLEPDLPGANVLDLFAGSGSLGIEALSRGAREATFIEQSGKVLRVLEDNIESLGLRGRSLVIRGDALRLVRERRVPTAPFDVVFVDPPYSSGHAERALRCIGPLVAPRGVVVVERARGTDADGAQDDASSRLELVRRRGYGSTEVDIYRSAGEHEPREGQ
ncbi:MAG: 16S rRNA (guanine(966)-N(2))-methyltransferase RsmD [Candidatus Eisenbacteria bacterium]|nr:16S rRNA (guanine(966)-N(2))-methyltransferase RsmD [Candidatus Eisenbacteria bacterium]